MRLIAEVEAVGAMAPAVGQREGADRDRQRLERRRLAVACRFAGKHACHIGFERQRYDRVAAARLRDADAQPHCRGGWVLGARCRVHRCRVRAYGDEHDDEPPGLCPQAAASPRKREMPSQIAGRLAINW